MTTSVFICNNALAILILITYSYISAILSQCSAKVPYLLYSYSSSSQLRDKNRESMKFSVLPENAFRSQNTGQIFEVNEARFFISKPERQISFY